MLFIIKICFFFKHHCTTYFKLPANADPADRLSSNLWISISNPVGRSVRCDRPSASDVSVGYACVLWCCFHLTNMTTATAAAGKRFNFQHLPKCGTCLPLRVLLAEIQYCALVFSLFGPIKCTCLVLLKNNPT